MIIFRLNDPLLHYKRVCSLLRSPWDLAPPKTHTIRLQRHPGWGGIILDRRGKEGEREVSRNLDICRESSLLVSMGVQNLRYVLAENAKDFLCNVRNFNIFLNHGEVLKNKVLSICLRRPN